MSFIARTRSILLVSVFLLLAAAGCEHIALIGRPTIERPDPPLTPRGVSVDTGYEVLAELERIDLRPREIYLRTRDGRTRIVSYKIDTRVIVRSREVTVSDLRPGDLVAIQLQQDSRGNEYADLIRVRDTQPRDIKGRDDDRRMLEGLVERVDYWRGSFELRPSSGSTVTVVLPHNPPASAERRFRDLRDGDYVRVEGKFVGADRFDLDSFSGPEAASGVRSWDIR